MNSDYLWICIVDLCHSTSVNRPAVTHQCFTVFLFEIKLAKTLGRARFCTFSFVCLHITPYMYLDGFWFSCGGRGEKRSVRLSFQFPADVAGQRPGPGGTVAAQQKCCNLTSLLSHCKEQVIVWPKWASLCTPPPTPQFLCQKRHQHCHQNSSEITTDVAGMLLTHNCAFGCCRAGGRSGGI